MCRKSSRFRVNGIYKYTKLQNVIRVKTLINRGRKIQVEKYGFEEFAGTGVEVQSKDKLGSYSS